MKDVELLAPVGSFESLKAAVQNGANAVYLGGKEFSARASANNFDKDELKEAVKYAHIRGVRVFVTTNTLIKQNELEGFIEYVKFLYDINIDALILQDIGAAMTIKKLLPDFELHASTQMVAHSLDDVNYLESKGFDRVVLARELNIDEIKYICDNTNVDIEVFVHGALCVCYSGQCLMSSMIGNRSGNRGRCAQPCRQRYTMIDIYTGEEVESNGDYLLSTRDLNAIEEINQIYNAEYQITNMSRNEQSLEIEIRAVYMYSSFENQSLNRKEETFKNTIQLEKNVSELNVQISSNTATIMPDSSINSQLEIQIFSSETNQLELINEIKLNDEENDEGYSMVIYFVKPGDSLWKIAKRFKSTIKEIATLNEIANEDKINIGDKLYIPRAI